MNLQQMRCLCAVADRRFNLSEVGRSLHTSQSAVTRQIQLLERELGFDVLVRRGKRILRFSREGEAVLAIARRMVTEAAGLRQLREDYHQRAGTRLTVATTHYHARYTLPAAILRFRQRHPEVSLALQQESPTEIAGLVASETADLGISVEVPDAAPDVVAIPCQSVNRIVITPVGHPLLKLKRPTLQQLAAYPLIAYDRKLSGGWKVLQAFEARGLQPDLALTAIDAEVIKIYVEAGMGVAVVQAPVYQRARDRGLRAIDASHLFAPAVTVLMLKPRVYVRDVVHDFIGTVMPGSVEARVRAAMNGR